jgi:NAD(P)-dependent dehydrogenase (short-subunit alcohol dehydrogenase family)
VTLLDRFRLDDNVAVVTGASSGVGVAFAVGLAETGAGVVVCARRAERLEETRAHVEALGRRCLAIRADVGLAEDCGRVVDAAMDAFGRVDVLVDNAGWARPCPPRARHPRRSPHHRRQPQGLLPDGPGCGRVMEPGSSIVNIGSVPGFTTAGLPQAVHSTTSRSVRCCSWRATRRPMSPACCCRWTAAC